MIRKNIYLPKTLEQRIRVLSHQRRSTEAEVIRELLEDGLTKRQPMSTGDALLGLAELGKRLGIKGPADLSERHDDYLYGEE
jgi:hypothetical protein